MTWGNNEAFYTVIVCRKQMLAVWLGSWVELVPQETTTNVRYNLGTPSFFSEIIMLLMTIAIKAHARG